MSEPLLSVCLITYNHANYIREAIEGVLMQKVNFSWELLIADDFSTDGTREIVLKYKKKHPEFIKLILQEKNVGPAQNWIDLIIAPKSKYIAYLEGDDYWTDPFKLQKQVDFLETNPEYGMVHTDFDQNYISNGLLKKNYWRDYKHRTKESQEGYVFEKVLIYETEILTVTVCFRRKIIEQEVFHELFKMDLMNGDYPLWCLIAYQSKIGYLPESTAVRNLLLKSATQGQTTNTYLKFYKSDLKVTEFLIKYYNLPKSFLQNPKLFYYKRTLECCYGSRDKQTFYRVYKELKKEGLPINSDLKFMNILFKSPFLYLLKRSFFYIKRKIRKYLPGGKQE